MWDECFFKRILHAVNYYVYEIILKVSWNQFLNGGTFKLGGERDLVELLVRELFRHESQLFGLFFVRHEVGVDVEDKVWQRRQEPGELLEVVSGVVNEGGRPQSPQRRAVGVEHADGKSDCGSWKEKILFQLLKFKRI